MKLDRKTKKRLGKFFFSIDISNSHNIKLIYLYYIYWPGNLAFKTNYFYLALPIYMRTRKIN